MVSAEKGAGEPMRMSIRALLTEVLTLLAVTREYALLEIDRGAAREGFLFVGGAYYGSEVDRLRSLLKEGAPVEVKLTSADSLVGLYGRPVATAMQLVLDPSGELSGAG